MPLTPEQKRFARLVALHQREVEAYIFANVPRWGDVDDIWQETVVRLWEEFEKYEQGTSFGAWATRVAYYQILTWRKKQQRSKLVFDDAFVEAIAAEREVTSSAETRHRLKALDSCLDDLSEKQRDLLTRFYAPQAKTKDIAAALQTSVDAVYKAVQRVRTALRTCIETRTREEGMA